MKLALLSIALLFVADIHAAPKVCDEATAEAKTLAHVQDSSYGKNISEVEFGTGTSEYPNGEKFRRTSYIVRIKGPSKAFVVGGAQFDENCEITHSLAGTLSKKIPFPLKKP